MSVHLVPESDDYANVVIYNSAGAEVTRSAWNLDEVDSLSVTNGARSTVTYYIAVTLTTGPAGSYILDVAKLP